MITVSINVVGFVEEHQPNIVEARLVDALGREHIFVDKCAIFTSVDLDRESRYPVPGVIACHIVMRETDARGREIVTIDTEEPWHVAATDGQTRFSVLAQQIAD